MKNKVKGAALGRESPRHADLTVLPSQWGALDQMTLEGSCAVHKGPGLRNSAVVAGWSVPRKNVTSVLMQGDADESRPLAVLLITNSMVFLEEDEWHMSVATRKGRLLLHMFPN